MLRKIAIAITSCLFLATGAAQAQYTMQGKISYERKMGIHRMLEDAMGDDNSSYIEAFKAQVPKFASHNFDLYFTTKQSMYKPGINGDPNPMFAMMGGLPGTDNQVWNDYETGKFIAFKNVYEQKFLVNDSMKKIQWKIMDEVRTIEGYSCRKAVCKLFDSVVVVAFYTDRIPVSGGPELFSGLPGMILQIAIPRLATTWVAKSVVVTMPAPTDLAAPAKGKVTNLADLQKTVTSSTKDWGKYASKSVWWTML
jgi:GLPGLI family protein